jgi:hypothetical protein
MGYMLFTRMFLSIEEIHRVVLLFKRSSGIDARRLGVRHSVLEVEAVSPLLQRDTEEREGVVGRGLDGEATGQHVP